MSIREIVAQKAERAKAAAKRLAVMNARKKNEALLAMADALEKQEEKILAANSQDLVQAIIEDTPKATLDRLMLSEERIKSMAGGLRKLAELPDPIGEIVEGCTRPNGLVIRKIRVPLGLVGMIYEARPNVTVDAAGLCLKAGNAVLLRGGSEAFNSNAQLVRILRQALRGTSVPEDSIRFIDDTDREAVDAMMELRGCIDVLIPRGGAGLIQKVVEKSRVPVIETGAGVCHTYVDETADLAMAKDIVLDAKLSRPAVCNAMETLLVHEKVADAFLSDIIQNLQERDVEVRGCERTMRYGNVVLATEQDWATEYNDLILSIKVVDSMEQAIEHINRYNTKHSETIVTSDYARARRFQQMVDAAVVYVNASTRFTDGFEFGYGAEIGISTQKLHARGPMGLEALTTVKYLVDGDGQIRV